MVKLSDAYGGAQPGSSKLAEAYSGKRKQCGDERATSSKETSSVTVKGRKPRLSTGSTCPCHKSFDRTCPQCVFGRHAQTWKETHGSVMVKKGAQKVRVVWLQARVSASGKWGMGCALCSRLREKILQEGSPRCRRQARKWDCKWGRFEISSLSQCQAAALSNHAMSQCHRAAIKFLEDPSAPLEVLVQPEASDEALLHGHVPQPEDWLKAFCLVRNPVSFLKGEKQSENDSYIAIRKCKVTRFSMKNLVSVMAEIVRRQKRAWIEKASHICVAVDDKAPYRLLRFRASFQAQDAQEEEPIAREGVLALLRHGTDSVSAMDVRELDEDYSARVAESVSKAIERLATPLGSDEPNEACVAAFRSHLWTVASDGHRANGKCVAILQRSFVNVKVLFLDRAHQIRRAALPVSLQQTFQEYWDDIFGSVGVKHALVPDLQNSDQWKLRFALLQKELSVMHGALPANFNRASVTLSYARQRFDSASCPAAKFVLFMLPLALLLAYQAADERLQRSVRVRSQCLLERLTGDRALVAGLSADFGNEAFVRSHDIKDHDPSRSLQETKDRFVARLEALFLQAMILSENPGEDEQCQSYSVRAVRTAMEAGPIQYGDRLHTLWSPVTKTRCTEIMGALQSCVNATVSRLNVDINPRDLQCCFAAFNLEAWWPAKQSLEAGDTAPWERCQARLVPCFRLLCKAAAQDVRQGALEFEAALAELLTVSTMEQVLKQQDSRLAWRRVLGYGAALRACGGRFPVLSVIVSWYISVIDGECQVERDLAILKSLLSEHRGSLDIDSVTLSDLLEMRLDGPQCQEEIASQVVFEDVVGPGTAAHPTGGVLQMTPFTRQCQALFIERHGRRFRCYSVRADKGQPRQKRKDSVISWKRSQRQAVNALVKHYQEDPSSLQTTCLGAGFERKKFVQKPNQKGSKNPAWDKNLAKFHKTTMAREKANLAARERLLKGLPAAQPALRPGNLFKAKPGRSNSDFIPLDPSAVVLDVTAEGMESPPLRDQITRPARPDSVSLPELLKAKVVVVDDVLAVEQMRTGMHLGHFGNLLSIHSSSFANRPEPGHLLLYVTIVAAGLGIVSAKEWAASTRLFRIRHYKPSAFSVKVNVHMTDAFWEDSRSVAKLIKHFCQRKNSVWNLTDAEEAHCTVTDLRSLHGFLSSVRRMSRDHAPGTQKGAGSGWHLGMGSQLLR
ncbi:unnamed protein product [Symbiodinium sp. CCMP2592]|nr:unnamed protein product [Symbiodinium sp. CCMP2592]